MIALVAVPHGLLWGQNPIVVALDEISILWMFLLFFVAIAHEAIPWDDLVRRRMVLGLGLEFGVL